MDTIITKNDYKNKLILVSLKQVVISLTEITSVCGIPFNVKLEKIQDDIKTEAFISKMRVIQKEIQNIS
jgi:archaellum biogenesis ATPase FlaH